MRSLQLLSLQCVLLAGSAELTGSVDCGGAEIPTDCRVPDQLEPHLVASYVADLKQRCPPGCKLQVTGQSVEEMVTCGLTGTIIDIAFTTEFKNLPKEGTNLQFAVQGVGEPCLDAFTGYTFNWGTDICGITGTDGEVPVEVIVDGNSLVVTNFRGEVFASIDLGVQACVESVVMSDLAGIASANGEYNIDSDPTEPTEPTEPTKPTEPTEPTKPTEPTEPTESTKPTEPIDTTSSPSTASTTSSSSRSFILGALAIFVAAWQ